MRSLGTALCVCLCTALLKMTAVAEDATKPGVLLGWRGEVLRCERMSNSSILVSFRATGRIVNQGKTALILPRRQFSAGMDIALSPIGTPPWGIDWSQNNEGLSLVTMEVTEAPDSKYFKTLTPRSSSTIVVTDSFVLSAEQPPLKSGKVARIGIRLHLGLGSVVNEPDNVLLRMEQARRWEKVGVTIPSHQETPWILVELPTDCRPV